MKPPAGAALISLRTEDRPDLELCIAAARPAQKVADRNASQQSEPVLLDDVLTMPALRGSRQADACEPNPAHAAVWKSGASQPPRHDLLVASDEKQRSQNSTYRV